MSLEKNIKKILVFRNGDIGNTLVAQPFFRLLKEYYPNSVLHAVVDNIGKEILKNDPNIDRFFIFNRKKDPLSKQLDLVKQWRKEKYDVSFHLRSGIRNEQLAFFSSIPMRIGFPLKGSFQFLTLKIKKNGLVHHSHLGRLLLEHFYEDVPTYLPKLYVDENEKKKIEKLYQKYNLVPGEYVVLHSTGKSVREDNWQLTFYNKIIDLIYEEYNLPCVVIGVGNEQEEIERTFKVKNKPIFWFADDIGGKSELIRQAKFFCGNDSGPFHIAECWNIPSIVLYRDNPGNYKKWYPLNDELSVPIFHCELKNEKLILGKIKIIMKRWL
jgi:ADP-heptose:LPS heptosyltransferase